MKNILKCAALITFFMLASCKKFLDKEPLNNQVVDNYYANTRDIETAVTGCYNALIAIKNSSELLFNENRGDNGTYPDTDNITSNADAYYPSILTVGISDTYVTNLWSGLYDLITRCNLVISHIDAATDPVLKAEYLGQVKFLRAWAYFDLVRYWGGVPLVLSPITNDEATNLARASQADVYSAIVADLQDSFAQFNIAVAGKYVMKYGQANKWAAEALLGKVYLAQGRPADALAPLADVYTNSGYILTPNYGDLFVVASETSLAAKEVLFPIRFTNGGLGLGNNFSTIAGITNVTTFGTNLTYWSNGLKAVFQNTSDITKDTRYFVTCTEYTASGTPAGNKNKRYIAKLVGLVANATAPGGYAVDKLLIAADGPLDWPELRFADVVLMYAECKGVAGGGIDILNRVRTRAKAPLLTTATLASQFNNDFQAAVLNERRMELAFENDRWFDMHRMGDAYTSAALVAKLSTDPAYGTYYTQTHALVAQIIAGGKVDPYRFLLPIPYNQLLLSKGMVQNPGYQQ